jgi:acetate kinase
MIDRIGLESSTLTYVTTATQLEEHLPIRDHKEGLQKIAYYSMKI